MSDEEVREWRVTVRRHESEDVQRSRESAP